MMKLSNEEGTEATPPRSSILSSSNTVVTRTYIEVEGEEAGVPMADTSDTGLLSCERTLPKGGRFESERPELTAGTYSGFAPALYTLVKPSVDILY